MNFGYSATGVRRSSSIQWTNSLWPISVAAYTVLSGRLPSRSVSTGSIQPCRTSASTVSYNDPELTLKLLSLCRSRRVDAISYGCIGCSCSRPSTASASVLEIFRFAIYITAP